MATVNHQKNSVTTQIFLFFSIILCSCPTSPSSESENKSAQENIPEQSNDPPFEPYPCALSFTYLTYLARTELDIYKEMSNYIKRFGEIESKENNIIYAYLEDYEDSSGKATSHLPQNIDPWEKAEVIAAHPIANFRMISRFISQFAPIVGNIYKPLERNLDQLLVKLSGDFPWPSEKNLEESMEAILRLHYTYNLNIEQFARGNVMRFETNVGLTPAQTFKIGTHAAQRKYFTLAMDWLKVTQSRILESNDLRAVSRLTFENTHRNIIDMHDRDFEKRSKSSSYWYMFQQPLGINPNAATLRSVNIKKFKVAPTTPHQYANAYKQLVLCDGEYLQTPKQMATLKCWYDHRHAYFYLFPLKAELLNEEPLLIQFHDLISEQWGREITRAALPSLRHAPEKDGLLRTGLYAHLEDEDIPLVPIASRIQIITGLQVRGTSEDYQVASYTPGGHVDSHIDAMNEANPFHNEVIKLKGNRAAVFLSYLSDVEEGGFTAFPMLGTFVRPIKGSAVLFYAALRNGQKDHRMVHTACPVLLGHKWTLTKRVYSNKNFLTWPCDTNPNI